MHTIPLTLNDKIFFLIFNFFHYKDVLPVYVPGVQRDQKMPNSHMELELQMVSSCHVGTEPRSSRGIANQ